MVILGIQFVHLKMSYLKSNTIMKKLLAVLAIFVSVQFANATPESSIGRNGRKT
jgi:hypothetical protein